MTTLAADVVTAGAATMRTVGLSELPPSSQTLVRTDRKYFVPLPQFERLLDSVDATHSVLDIGGRRLFGYRSTYYDDATFGCYRAHLQGRRQRWKVRTRTYLDTGLSMLEVKLKDAREQTVKVRTWHAGGDSPSLDAASMSFVVSVIAGRYGTRLPDDSLSATIATDYRRTTFVDLSDLARVTVDVEVRCGSPERHAVSRDDHVLVETKSPRGCGPADRALRALGVRPVSMSKYCVGLSAVRPDLPSNPWHSTVRRYFIIDEKN